MFHSIIPSVYSSMFTNLNGASYATLYGSAGIGTSDPQGSVCYGAVCGADLFAQLEGPYVDSLF